MKTITITKAKARTGARTATTAATTAERSFFGLAGGIANELRTAFKTTANSRAAFAVVSAFWLFLVPAMLLPGGAVAAVATTPLPVVGIQATVPNTMEPGPTIRIIPGKFLLTRRGETNESLTVLMGYEGTATRGVDYEKLPELAVIPAGETSVELTVFPFQDEIVEDAETVVATIRTWAGRPPTYTVNDAYASAKVVIADSTPKPASIAVSAPKPGAEFALGETIPIRATAVDPKGYMARVEFYDGDKMIGFSMLEFFRAPDPGTPIDHSYDWVGATAGEHVITVRGVDALGVIVVSARVPIVVVKGDTKQPVVWIETVDPEASEMSPLLPAIDSARLRIHREGDLSKDTLVFFSLEGTATPGADFKDFGNSVSMASGVAVVDLELVPIFDELIEGIETVVVTLQPQPFVGPGPLPDDYVIDATRAAAKVAIRDLAVGPTASIVINSPKTGQTFAPGEVVRILATAVDKNSEIRRVEFFDGDKSIGVSEILTKEMIVPGRPREHLLAWTNAPAGAHRLHAEGLDSFGVRVVSPGVGIVVSGRDTPPGVVVVEPKPGATYESGSPIRVRAEAGDRDRRVLKLAILADEQVIGSAAEVTSVDVVWKDAPVGVHVLTAVASDNAGQSTVSSPVRILVRGAELTAFVTRGLPGAYAPGEPFTVILKAEPPQGAGAYAIQDAPPVGWVVSEPTEGGSVDPLSGAVKFGPFTDDQARALSYRVTPPMTAAGRQEFKGLAALDGKAYPIRGDQAIEGPSLFHPADVDPQDGRITLTELTAYAAAWKTDAKWATGPSPIPVSYVTRAAALWKSGELYRYDAQAGEAPMCWVSTVPGDVLSPKIGDVSRAAPAMLDPGAPATVQITISPKAGTRSYALEEALPNGWKVVSAGQEGAVGADGASVRWGPFLGSEPRTLSYQVQAPADVATVGAFRGKAAFDGLELAVAGVQTAPAASDSTQIRIGVAEKLSEKKVRLGLVGRPGQHCVLEGSADLLHWSELDQVMVGADGTVSVEDASAAGASRFYRLRVPVSP